MKILNFGSCNLDFVYLVEHIVRPGETIETKELRRYPGGKGLNQSIALSRAGAKVYHAGCVGGDDDMLRKLMQENGVNISHIRETEECTGQAIIQVEESGENCIFLYHGANFAVSREQIDAVFSSFEPGDVLLLQNEISEIPYLVHKGKELGFQIFLNPSPFNAVMREIDLHQVDYLILNQTEAEDFLGENFLEKVKVQYPELHVVLTLGKEGSIYQYKEEKIRQKAYPVTAVDTTAAGDTFTGYYIAKLFECGPAAAMNYASAAAGLAASRKGAAPSIPALKEVEQFIKKEKTPS